MFWIPSASAVRSAYSVIAVASSPLTRRSPRYHSRVISQALVDRREAETTSPRRQRRSADGTSAWARHEPTSGRPRLDPAPQQLYGRKTPACATGQPVVDQPDRRERPAVCGIIQQRRRHVSATERSPIRGQPNSCSEAFVRDFRGGSTIPKHAGHRAANTTGETSALRAPRLRPVPGITNAGEAACQGCAVWRIPMARPRC